MFKTYDLTATRCQLFTSRIIPEYGADNKIDYTLREMGWSMEEVEEIKVLSPGTRIILLENKFEFVCEYWRKRIEKAVQDDIDMANESRHRHLYD